MAGVPGDRVTSARSSLSPDQAGKSEAMLVPRFEHADAMKRSLKGTGSHVPPWWQEQPAQWMTNSSSSFQRNVAAPHARRSSSPSTIRQNHSGSMTASSPFWFSPVSGGGVGSKGPWM